MSLAFGVASFIMVCIISFAMNGVKLVPTNGTSCFKKQLVLFKIYIIFDTLCYLYAVCLTRQGLEIEKNCNETMVLRAIALISFAMLIELALLNFRYAVLQASDKVPNPMLAEVFVPLLVFFLPVSVSIENGGLVFLGSAKDFLDNVCGVVLVAIGVFLIKMRYQIPRKKKECCLVWMVVWSSLFVANYVALQYLMAPIAFAFCLLINFIFIENPGRKQGSRKETTQFRYIQECVDYFERSGVDYCITGVKLPSDTKADIFFEAFEEASEDLFLLEEDAEDLYVVCQNDSPCVLTLNDCVKELGLQAICFDGIEIKDARKLSIFFQNNAYRVEKGAIRFVSESEFLKQDRELETKREIEEALANNRVVAYIQPIYSVKDRRFTCGECLCRIRRENGELMMPGKFIEVAEKYGLICEIETQMFKSMCKTLQRKDEIGLEYLDANLSIRKGESPILYDEYFSILKSYGINGNSVNLEITETDVAESKGTLIKNMDDLRSIGIRFSLDDFGVGESNLGYVIDMPIDAIKFDREIFQKATLNEKARVVVQHAIDMAHNLGLKVVAEGVETESDVAFCEEMGVDYIQGFYFSKPIPSDEFEKFCMEKNFGKTE